MKWSGRTYWLSRGLRSILTHMFKSLWWILMANNHACPVLQSGTAEGEWPPLGSEGFTFGEWSYCTSNGASTNVRDRSASAGRLRPVDSEPSHLRPRSTAPVWRLLIGQLWGPVSAPPPIPSEPPAPLLLGWRGKIRAQQPLWTTKLHLNRHLLLLFTEAAHSFSLKDTQERKAGWEMMNYLTMMSNCFKADILFLEGKGLGVRQCLWRGPSGCLFLGVAAQIWPNWNFNLLLPRPSWPGIKANLFCVCHMVGDGDGANFLETNLIFVNCLEKK